MKNVPKVRTKQLNASPIPLSRCCASVQHTQRPSLMEGNQKGTVRCEEVAFPFALTVEDLETTTAKTSWISSVRVGAPCPLRKSGPCSAGSGISRCPKSLFVSLGRSCALPARGGAERAQPGSAASTNVWAPSRSRCCRRRR